MTPRIPLRRCRKCLHYRRETCQLPDLDPCNFAPINGNTRPRCWARAEAYIIAAIAIITALAIIAATAIFFACRKSESNPTESVWIKIDAVSAVELLRNQRGNELSDFDKLIMAIAYTESRFRDDAVGKAGDSGILQITEPYVREVNRISGANFKREYAFCIDSSLAMFAVIQDYYNPAHGIDEAIYRHNKSESYRRTVLENLEMINRYEALRAKLIMTHF